MALLDYWIEVWKFPKPIICQVQGACLSGAGELLAVSDIVIASKTATFGHPAGRDLRNSSDCFLLAVNDRHAEDQRNAYIPRKVWMRMKLRNLGLINQAVSPDNLESTTRNLALDIAKTPVNHLVMILKKATNNFYDNMNLEKSVRQASDLDAEFHQSPTFLSFFRLVST